MGQWENFRLWLGVNRFGCYDSVSQVNYTIILDHDKEEYSFRS